MTLLADGGVLNEHDAPFGSWVSANGGASIRWKNGYSDTVTIISSTEISYVNNIGDKFSATKFQQQAQQSTFSAPSTPLGQAGESDEDQAAKGLVKYKGQWLPIEQVRQALRQAKDLEQKNSAEQPGATIPDDLRTFLAADRPALPIGSPSNLGVMGCFKGLSFCLQKTVRPGFYFGKVSSVRVGGRYNHDPGWWHQPVILTGINLDGQLTEEHGSLGIPENYVFRAVDVIKGVDADKLGAEDHAIYIFELVYDLNKYQSAIGGAEVHQGQAQRQAQAQQQETITTADWSSIGETRSELERKLGKPARVDVNAGTGLLDHSYLENGFIIVVQYYKNKVSGIGYGASDGTALSNKDIDTLLNANAQGNDWHYRGPVKGQPSWIRSDGDILATLCKKGLLTVLNVKLLEVQVGSQVQTQERSQPKEQAPAPQGGVIKTLVGKYGSFDSAYDAKIANEQRDSGMTDAMAETVMNGGNGDYIGGPNMYMSYKIEREHDDNGNRWWALYRYSAGAPYSPWRKVQ